MENNIRFRNHISFIFEKVVRTASVAIFIFVANFVTDLEEMPKIGDILILLGVLLACVLVAFLWHYFIWSKTYISIQDETLIIEKNTLNKKKNTIGIKNISNINLEQNLFEMALGTCKLKLDTNSLTTAEETDVNIVLKKKDAEEFRVYLLSMREVQEGIKKESGSGNSFTKSSKEIFLHGLFSLNLGSLFVLVVVVFGGIGFMEELKATKDASLFDKIISILVVIWFLGGMIWKVLREFLRYLEFSIERREDTIYLEYGILKRVTYSIPVSKINAVRLNQTMLARIGKRYMVEVVNVGMGNDEEEQHSFFLPYGKRDEIVEQLKLLLPEFDIDLGSKSERQPKGVLVVWVANGVMWLSGVTAIAAICAEFLDTGVAMVVVVGVVITLYIILLRGSAYMTDGAIVGEKILTLSQGHFSRYYLFVKYEKIQFLIMKQCVVAKKFGIVKGQIHLLASVKNRIHNLPYMAEEKMEELCKYVK